MSFRCQTGKSPPRQRRRMFLATHRWLKPGKLTDPHAHHNTAALHQPLSVRNVRTSAV